MTGIRSGPSNQVALLFQRRFGPYFLTQLLTAANDSLLKCALLLLANAGLLAGGIPAHHAGLTVGVIFLLPFVVVSASLGPWLNRQDKGLLMRRLKAAEIGIMALGAWGLNTSQTSALLLAVGLQGASSACFGPAKLAYLPEHLDDRELMGANGITLASTYLAILAGYMGASHLVAQGAAGVQGLAGCCMALAVAGWLISWGMPVSPRPHLAPVTHEPPLSSLRRTLANARHDPVLFHAVLGVGWTWFVLAFYNHLIPELARDVLRAGAGVNLLLLGAFAYGLLLASVAAEMISRQSVEIGLALMGIMGAGSIGGDLYFSTQGWSAHGLAAPMDVATFWAAEGSWRIVYDVFRLALGLGLFAAPLLAYIQWRVDRGQVARMMALSNVFNAGFVALGLGLVLTLSAWGMGPRQVMVVGAVLNGLAVAVFFLALPESLVRLTVLFVTRFMYLAKARGQQVWPSRGPAVLVCNHVSLLDVMIVSMISPRRLLVLCDEAAIRTRGLGWFYRRSPAVALPSPQADAQAYAHAVASARQALDEGELVCVFPEGRLTPDGQLQPFIDIVPAIVQGRSVPVIPAALHNMWGSSFSRIDGEPVKRLFRRRVYQRVGLVLGSPLPPDDVTTERLQTEVSRLLQEPRP